MPCEPYTAHKVQGKPYFCYTCPCANDIVYARFESFRTFLYIFMSIAIVFACQDLRVNVPVAIFFPTEDYKLTNKLSAPQMFPVTLFIYAMVSAKTWQLVYPEFHTCSRTVMTEHSPLDVLYTNKMLHSFFLYNTYLAFRSLNSSHSPRILLQKKSVKRICNTNSSSKTEF